MVWYGMFVSKHKHKDKENLGTFGSGLERLESFGKRSNAFRVPRERLGAFGTLGRLVSIIPYVCMVCMVCMVWYGMHNNIKQEFSRI